VGACGHTVLYVTLNIITNATPSLFTPVSAMKGVRWYGEYITADGRVEPSLSDGEDINGMCV